MPLLLLLLSFPACAWLLACRRGGYDVRGGREGGSDDDLCRGTGACVLHVCDQSREGEARRRHALLIVRGTYPQPFLPKQGKTITGLGWQQKS